MLTGTKLTAQNTIAKACAGAGSMPQMRSAFSIATWNTPKNPGAWGSATVTASATLVKQPAANGSGRRKAWKSR